MIEKIEFIKEILEKTRKLSGIPTYAAFGDGEWFYTAKTISWTASEKYSEIYKDVHVPVGFVTDLTSVPRAFWALLPRDGAYLPAAIVHDFSYWDQDQSRDASDEIFNIGMAELNVGDSTRLTIYNAVRFGGGNSWDENARVKSEGGQRVLKRFPERPDVTWEDWKQEPDVFEEHR